MHENETVPIGLAVAIFALLGVLIICSFIFAGWSILQLRNTPRGAVLALGKTVEFIESEEYEEFEREYLEPAFTMHFFGNEIGTEALFSYAPEIIGGELFMPVQRVFGMMGYMEGFDEESGVTVFTNIARTNVIIITEGEDTFTINDEVHPLYIPEGVLGASPEFALIPVLESLGYIVSLDEENNTLTIAESAPVIEIEPEEPDEAPAAAAQPRPAATPAPLPVPVVTSCGTCGGTGTVLCTGCNGVGGGREMLLTPGIPHEFAESGLQWWCTVCMAQARMTCGTCNGTGSVTIQ